MVRRNPLVQQSHRDCLNQDSDLACLCRRPVEVETDQFKGKLSIWIQGLDTSPPDLFQGKRRKTAIVIQGTFKEPLLYEDVLTGQEFGRTPTNLPARWLVDSVLLKVSP